MSNRRRFLPVYTALALTGIVLFLCAARSQASDREETAWWVRFHIVSSSVESALSTGEVVSCPVAPELYRIQGDSLIGLISILTMGQGEESIASVMQLSNDTHISFYPGAWDIKVDIPDGRFRVVLLPDPLFWTPSTVTQEKVVKDDDQFRITGVLNLVDRAGNVTFPPKLSPDTVIRFERVNAEGATTALGFSAYVDFEIAGGQLVHRDLTLGVDCDGDGKQDQVITGAEYDPERSKK